jgi:arylsulfatase A-like enzyme
LGKTTSIHDTLYWEHEGGKAIRVGVWKMSALKKSEWELYNLAEDRSESVNLANKFIEKVKQLDAAWNRWADQMKIDYKK